MQLNEFKSLRQGGWSVLEYDSKFMELLIYALHLSTENLWVNKFVYGLNLNIRKKVCILMPRTVQEALQKYIIHEEELVGGGQSWPARYLGEVVNRPGVHSSSSLSLVTWHRYSFKSPTTRSQRRAPGRQRPPYRPPQV